MGSYEVNLETLTNYNSRILNSRKRAYQDALDKLPFNGICCPDCGSRMKDGEVSKSGLYEDEVDTVRICPRDYPAFPMGIHKTTGYDKPIICPKCHSRYRRELLKREIEERWKAEKDIADDSNS